jgi:hypothetical protein
MFENTVALVGGVGKTDAGCAKVEGELDPVEGEEPPVVPVESEDPVDVLLVVPPAEGVELVAAVVLLFGERAAPEFEFPPQPVQ